jgi:transcriptional regulator GlxA family with amidase domain
MKNKLIPPSSKESPELRPDPPGGLLIKITEQLVPGWKEEIKMSQLNGEHQQSVLKRFISVAGQHLSDKHFGVRELLIEMQTSRTQLHRKLKATTGQSANELLRSIKMEKALLLLQSTTMPIAKVASKVGYGSPSCFSKIFGEHFGFLPSTAKERSLNKS